MIFSFEGRCVLELEHITGTKSQHKGTSINLDCSKNISKRDYFKDDLPNQAGTKVLTNVFVQGLVANIKHAHALGYWNEVEHIRYIIDELGRGFVENSEISESTF